MRTRDVVDKKTREMIDAKQFLRKLINSGDRLFTMTVYVGNSGSAYVKVFKIVGDDVINLTWNVAKACEMSIKERDGAYWIRTTGGNYSRAQHVVDHVSLVLCGEFGALKYSEL